jgi:hypothetical protein
VAPKTHLSPATQLGFFCFWRTAKALQAAINVISYPDKHGQNFCITGLIFGLGDAWRR